METNNGVEAQNKALKYKFLPRKAVSLSCIATIIIERFLLEQHRNYLFLNFQMNPNYRAYNAHIPLYLQGRPRNIILHCLGREEKARKVLSPNDILEADEEKGIFLVRGESGNSYTIDFGKESGNPSCTCQDWMTNNIPCKHFFLIFISICEWDWNALPQSYLQSPYLINDDNTVEKAHTEDTNVQYFSNNDVDLMMPIENELPLKVSCVCAIVEHSLTSVCSYNVIICVYS